MTALQDLLKLKTKLQETNSLASAAVISTANEKAVRDECHKMLVDQMVIAPVGAATIVGIQILALEGVPDDMFLTFSETSDALNFVQTCRELAALTHEPIATIVKNVLHFYRTAGVLK